MGSDAASQARPAAQDTPSAMLPDPLAEPRRLTATGRAAIGAMLLSVLLGALFLYIRATGPSDGARIPPGNLSVWRPDGVVVRPIEPRPEGLQADDLVVALDGRSLESWTQELLIPQELSPDLRVGQTVVYTVIRDGQTLNVPVVLEPYPLGSVLVQSWGILALSLLFIPLTWFVFFKRPANPGATALGLASAGFVTVVAGVPGLTVADLRGGILFWLYWLFLSIGNALVQTGVLHTWLVFPRPLPFVARHPWVVPAIYAFPVAVFLLGALPLRLLSASNLDWFGSWQRGEAAFQGTYAFLWAVAAVLSFRNTRDPVGRQQIRVVIYAVLLGGAVYVAAVLLQMALRRPILDWNVIALAFIPVNVALAAAILRYRLFDVDILISRTLVYVPLTAILAGLYTGLVALFQRLPGAIVGDRSDTTVVITTLVVAAAFTPVRNFLQGLVDRRFKPAPDPATGLSELGAEIRLVLGVIDVDGVTRRVLAESVAAFGARSGGLYLRRDGRLQLTQALGDRPDDAELTVPLRHAGEDIGLLVLGPRQSGEGYSARDRELLEEVAGLTAQALRVGHSLRRPVGGLAPDRPARAER